MNLIDKLIERAKRTPYFHLEGYMERYCLKKAKKVLIELVMYVVLSVAVWLMEEKRK